MTTSTNETRAFLLSETTAKFERRKKQIVADTDKRRAHLQMRLKACKNRFDAAVRGGAPIHKWTVLERRKDRLTSLFQDQIATITPWKEEALKFLVTELRTEEINRILDKGTIVHLEFIGANRYVEYEHEESRPKIERVIVRFRRLFYLVQITCPVVQSGRNSSIGNYWRDFGPAQVEFATASRDQFNERELDAVLGAEDKTWRRGYQKVLKTF